MQYGVLGTTQALRDDGTEVPLGGQRLRALLAALVLRGGRAVPAWALIEEIWGEQPPADPQDALQTLVARLRRALGADQLVSAADGYRLTGHRSDLRRFEELATAADTGSLRAALALWRGPALADLPTRTDAAARCEAQRDAVRLRLLAEELALGNPAGVLAELAELIERQPLDEPLRALQLRALHRAGRTPEALLGYQDFRRRLAEELGTDPGPELRALHLELLAPAPGPTPAPAPAAPPERAPAPQAARTNLRPRMTSFVGRDTDLAALRSALASRRLLTLIGPGGSGKTRLAQQAAEARAGDFPDGVWMVELAPLDDPQAVTGAVLSALGLRATQLHVGGKTDPLAAELLSGPLGTAPEAETPLRQLLDHCAQRRLLLVLDNCEHLVQPAAELAERLITGCPGVTVLATSREPLGVPGEAVVPVDPLPDPAALRLLAERGAAARPGFDPADPAQDPEACAEICRRLDGLPLAIELAAARLRALTPRQLADRLDGRFQLLGGGTGSRTLLPRQQTLRAVVDWSWDLLDKPERTLLARLSVFAGGWTLEAVEEICADDSLPREEAVALLASLVDKSLVQVSLRTADGRGPRYRMLETIHEYARERLAEQPADEEAEMTRRHLVWARELARTTDPLLRGGEQLGALALLEAEHDNLRAALRRAVAGGEQQEALCLVLSLAWFWTLRDFQEEARNWVAAVAAIYPDEPAAERPGPPSQEPLPQGPLDLPPPWSAELQDEAVRGLRVLQLVSLGSEFGRMPTQPQQQAVAAMLTGYRPELPQSARLPVLYRVQLAMQSGLMNELYPGIDDLVESCRLHDRPWELAYALQLRCKLRNDQSGQRVPAEADAAESLGLFTRLGDRWGMAEALAGQSETAGMIGDYGTAARCAREAIELAESVGADQSIPILQVRLGDALLGAGSPEEGEHWLRLGVESSHSHGPFGQGAGFYGAVVLAALRAQQGRFAEARGFLEPLLPPFSDDSLASMLGGMLDCFLGWIDAMEGRPEEGRQRLRRGLASILDHPMASFVDETFALLMAPTSAYILLACHRAGLGRAEHPELRAIRLLGAHDSRIPLTAVHHLARPMLAETADELRRIVGDEAYEAARAEGAALDTDGIVALLRD
ncbi:BTAD domain-containing putative transcriptional regulator [Streptacidiphilus sp. N1-10]|uniref:BTAD domain-containing putative transcriptional regulator n=1 Tax=Streptacidiphilus jeojiensis TaxID=3229225 RepID=A0ABV6XSX7_9ACTN